MNVKVLGIGNINSLSFYSSFLIDNILINTPPGLLKKLKEQEIEFDEIHIILITQIKGETYLDLPMFIYHEYLRKRKKPLIIIGPKELKRKIKKLLNSSFKNNILNELDITFIDALRIQNANLTKDYRFSFINLKHEYLKYNYGLIIKKGNISLGYIGETKDCPGLSYLLKEVKNCIITISEEDDKSINHQQFEILTQKYNTVFIPVGYSEQISSEIKQITNTKIIKTNEQFYL